MNGQQGEHISHGTSKHSLTKNADLLPLTTATTPPASLHGMQPYGSNGQGYDTQRQMYSTPSSQPSPYQTNANGPHDRMYSQPGPYGKNDMGPPSNRHSVAGAPSEAHDSKNGILSSEHATHQPGEEDTGDHEHDPEYTHDSGAYDANRASYNYTAPGVGSLANESNIAPDMTGSPSHPPTSGRATPRSAAQPQTYYQHPGYGTPPRIQSSSSLHNVMSNDRPPTNGAPAGDVYAPAPDMSNSMSNGYAPQQPILNGAAGGIKRSRDDEDVGADPSGGLGAMDLKRRKTMMESTVSAPVYDAMNRPASSLAAPRHR